MASIGSRGILIALLAPCFAQGRLDEFLGVKDWHSALKIAGWQRSDRVIGLAGVAELRRPAFRVIGTLNPNI